MQYCAFLSVVPLAGTWIETRYYKTACCISAVVPLAGTWIETMCLIHGEAEECVVPLAGTWIETIFTQTRPKTRSSRSLRGNVD